VLDGLGADIVGLNEIDSGEDGREEQLEALGRLTGMTAVAGATLRHESSHYGNGLLTRLPVRAVHRHGLEVEGAEPRGLLVAELEAGGGVLRIGVTHLGLRESERREQADRILRLLQVDGGPVGGDVGPVGPLALLGDFNAWRPGSRVVRRLQERFGRQPAPRTFPAAFPLLSLDRIWAGGGAGLQHVQAVRTPLTRVASDHLPVTALLTLPAAS
jgi:endonuclease/exonuclease/phosphatase family metal-dependent hydrolase